MDETKINIMENVDVKKAIFKLALPTMMAMVVQLIYNLTDTFFIGQLNDANQVAALSLSFPIFIIVTSIGNIFANGGASFISRSLGEKNYNEAKKTNATSFYSAIILGGIFTVLMLIFLNPILNIIGTSSNTFSFTQEYTQVIVSFSILLILQVAFAGLVRAEGQTTKAMLGMMIGNGINIILDPIFIFVFDMGIGGAAWATVIGNACGVLYYLIYYLRKKSILSISLKWFKPSKRIFSEIFKIGIPASLGQLVMSLSFILVNVFAASYGDNVVAGYGIHMRISSIAIMLIIGLAQGYQPFAGYNYGAKKSKRLLKAFQITMLYTTILAVVFTVVFAVFAENIFSVFIKDSNVIEYGVKILRAFIWCLPLFGIQMTLMISFQATGKAVKALLVSLGRQCILYLPLLFILNHFFGFEGFIYAQPIADILTTIMAVLLSFSFMKEIKNLNINTTPELIKQSS